MSRKPAAKEAPTKLSAILAEAEKQSSSIQSDWQVLRQVSDMLVLHVPVSRQTLSLALPVELTADSFEGHYFYELNFMTVEKTVFKNLPSFATVPAHIEMRLRTFIRYNGLPGYFNLESYVDSAIAAKIMGHAFGYPYKTANIKHATDYYSFDDPEHKRSVNVAWSPGIETANDFDKWISGRNFSIQQHKDIFERQDSYCTGLLLKHATINDFKIRFSATSLDEDTAHVFHPLIAQSFHIVYSDTPGIHFL